MSERGFLPCFSQYLFDDFPSERLYQYPQFVEKVKNLLSNLVDSKGPFDLKNKGIGKEIQTIRPNDSESKWIINKCSFPHNLYRIDYGNNPFRIIFGLSNENRIAFIFAFDTDHSTYSKKQKKY